VDVDKSEHECLQPIQAKTLSFLQFTMLMFVSSQCQFQNGSCTSRKLLENLVT
jgi:hypothetical protein